MEKSICPDMKLRIHGGIGGLCLKNSGIVFKFFQKLHLIFKSIYTVLLAKPLTFYFLLFIYSPSLSWSEILSSYNKSYFNLQNFITRNAMFCQKRGFYTQ